MNPNPSPDPKRIRYPSEVRHPFLGNHKSTHMNHSCFSTSSSTCRTIYFPPAAVNRALPAKGRHPYMTGSYKT
ncbi:hypothetical protein HPP92_008059 [Vanilla planifolia]|uniref:Uncharacterized protein n=1 Tax=Vanilla planifolia TaxID=51239 RepID=A0A835V9B5_VANPL|nr:hypothetical protein HPP92_008059 [Vanilla planifolia]